MVGLYTEMLQHPPLSIIKTNSKQVKVYSLWSSLTTLILKY